MSPLPIEVGATGSDQEHTNADATAASSPVGAPQQMGGDDMNIAIGEASQTSMPVPLETDAGDEGLQAQQNSQFYDESVVASFGEVMSSPGWPRFLIYVLCLNVIWLCKIVGQRRPSKSMAAGIVGCLFSLPGLYIAFSSFVCAFLSIHGDPKAGIREFLVGAFVIGGSAEFLYFPRPA